MEMFKCKTQIINPNGNVWYVFTGPDGKDILHNTYGTEKTHTPGELCETIPVGRTLTT